MTNIITKHLETLTTTGLDKDEYINKENGLIYCNKCHTPRQSRHELNGKIYTPHIDCQCQAEEKKKEEEIRCKQEFQNHISRMKSSGLQDKALYEYCFSNDNGVNEEMVYAHRYVDNWNEMKANGLGFLLWGDVGTGKSFFAGCIANALLEQCVPVLMTNFAKILNALSTFDGQERNNYINSLYHYSLLIIDDLGVECDSPYVLEQIFNVIDSRCRSGLPLIVTTNLPLQELQNPKDLEHERIYNRILEKCIPLKINNQNIRSLNASANMKTAKELFSKI